MRWFILVILLRSCCLQGAHSILLNSLKKKWKKVLFLFPCSLVCQFALMFIRSLLLTHFNSHSNYFNTVILHSEAVLSYPSTLNLYWNRYSNIFKRLNVLRSYIPDLWSIALLFHKEYISSAIRRRAMLWRSTNRDAPVKWTYTVITQSCIDSHARFGQSSNEYEETQGKMVT